MLIFEPMTTKKALLIIMDGWGHGIKRRADAIALAKTPFVDSLYRKYPNAELVTFGEDVGLPQGQMGNSEVGHLNIGAGRVVYQELARINKAVREGTLQTNAALLQALAYAKKNNKPLHFIGLVSDGGVHSHINHLKALCSTASAHGVKSYIHAFTDGRDCDPKSGFGFLADLQAHIATLQECRIATVIGRYWAMDRDKRWERVKLAYDLIVNGIGENIEHGSLLTAIKSHYDSGVTDEFLKGMVVHKSGLIKEGDVVLCFNFRTDRPREITEVLTQFDLPEFGMKKLDLNYVTMTRYDATYKRISVMFETDDLVNTIGEVLSAAGKTQVRIAETEKYPHVSFFFSGGRETPFLGERRLMVPSPKIATYDLQPEMSAHQITDTIVQDIQTNAPDFICLNYANTDMVGHTGVFSAAIKAAQTVDTCVKRLVRVALKENYKVLIIADHGNSDLMVNEDDSPNTAHTLNMVPCILVGKGLAKVKLRNGRLADVAPTILGLMNVKPSKEMTGESLIVG
jgi:2,3-bisphosphoglycerate-independent phosphoglycerate mutase